MFEIKIWIARVLQTIIALGLINVWLLRFSHKTKYRAGNTENMKEEFTAYGLPIWFMYFIGFVKVLIALIMLIILFIPKLMPTLGISALIMLSVLMLGAISMHIKVKDTLIKVLPAISMLLMSIILIYLVI